MTTDTYARDQVDANSAIVSLWKQEWIARDERSHLVAMVTNRTVLPQAMMTAVLSFIVNRRSLTTEKPGRYIEESAIEQDRRIRNYTKEST